MVLLDVPATRAGHGGLAPRGATMPQATGETSPRFRTRPPPSRSGLKAPRGGGLFWGGLAAEEGFSRGLTAESLLVAKGGRG